MRKMTWLIAAALMASTAGCVESYDQSGYGSGYGNGYSSGYYPSSGYSSGYYSQPSVNNYYYNPSPTVVTQTRYVPVPTPVAVPSGRGDRSNDHRWSGHRDNTPPPTQHVDRPHPTSPAPQANNSARPTPTPNTGNSSNRGHGNWRDRDGDGKPDRPDRRS